MHFLVNVFVLISRVHFLFAVIVLLFHFLILFSLFEDEMSKFFILAYSN